MARTGYASAGATSACAIAQHPCDRPQVLPAYGLQDLRNEEQKQKTKSNPNTMCLLSTPGGNRGTGHFYLAKNRTFLLCVDRLPKYSQNIARAPRTAHAGFAQKQTAPCCLARFCHDFVAALRLPKGIIS